jgi:hypothetical protein
MKPKSKKQAAAKSANTYKATRNALKVRKFVAAAADIGPLPPVADIQRKEQARNDLDFFLKTYFGSVLYRPFSDAHKDLISAASEIILNGGKNAIVMPRGGGKTALNLLIALWAILYHRNFVVLVGATASMAKRLCDDLKQHLQAPLLVADFPELVCFAKLQGISQRAKTQTSQGVLTHVGISSTSITFPTLPNLETAGRTVVCAGLTGAIRGLHKVSTDANGNETIIRPDLVLCDDLSKRGTVAETESRERLLNADVLGLAGHDVEIAALYCGTIIADDDLTSRILANPAWRGKKWKMVESWGSQEQWKEFDSAWRLEASGEAASGTAAEVYKRIKPNLKGAKVLDPYLYGKGEIDALHHARCKFLSVGEVAFASEYQNTPLQLSVGVDYSLHLSQVLKKANGLARYELPPDSVKCVCGLDVNKYAVSYCVAAFTPSGSCSVIDYGWYTPQKNAPIYTNSENAENKITEAVGAALDSLYNAKYGDALDLVAVDSGWAAQAVGNAIEAARKRYKGKRIYASKGWSSDRYEPPRNRKLILSRGQECDLRKVFPSGYLLHFNSTFWNIRAQKSFLLADGTDGETTLFGTKQQHRPFAEQIVSQELTRLSQNKQGRTVAQWKISGKNEMLDCLSICLMLNTLGLVSLRSKGKEDKAANADADKTKADADADKADNANTETAASNAEQDKPLTLGQIWKRKKAASNWAVSW